MNDPPDPGGSIPSVACNVTVMSQDESSADTDHTIVDWAIPSNSRKRSKTAKICKHCNKKKRKHKMAGKSEGCLCVDSDEKNSTVNAKIPEKQRDPSILPALSENISQPQAESANSRKFYESVERWHMFLECREYKDFEKSLNYASKYLVTCVEYCASIINKRKRTHILS
ncbi:hypothetical protein ACJJTC_015357 [Scirpophaga incertulas]